jgi:sugar phosphate isomerase/epimerase
MTMRSDGGRPLGTMVAYGFPDRPLDHDLAIARTLGASVLEIFPVWRTEPDPGVLRGLVADAGLAIHSAHGCWGGQSIRADRVDLGDLNPPGHAASVDDVRRCVDWLAEAGGKCLVVHPGGLSNPEQAEARRAALARALTSLAEHARGTGVTLCVENMPPGVYPGSRMGDLRALVDELGLAEVGLALDTGHAHISADLVSETLAAGPALRTTHVHDNNGRQDSHEPPGLGSIVWDDWPSALDRIGYDGPVMLECIRHLRAHPETLNEGLFALLSRLIARS